jgi:hypothetical protein
MHEFGGLKRQTGNFREHDVLDHDEELNMFQGSNMVIFGIWGDNGDILMYTRNGVLGS